MGKKKKEDADDSNVSSDTDHDNGKSDHDTRTRMAAFKFNEFDSGKEPWRYYIQRFELETLIQNLDLPETKRNLLLKCIGAANYRMVVDHFDPTPILQVSFKSIKEFLDSFFKPPTSLLQERIRFGECKQKPEQSVAQFVNDLRSAAINCAFGATLDERLRDQFLIGLQNPAMLEEIFTQHPGEKLNLQMWSTQLLLSKELNFSVARLKILLLHLTSMQSSRLKITHRKIQLPRARTTTTLRTINVSAATSHGPAPSSRITGLRPAKPSSSLIQPNSVFVVGTTSTPTVTPAQLSTPHAAAVKKLDTGTRFVLSHRTLPSGEVPSRSNRLIFCQSTAYSLHPRNIL